MAPPLPIDRAATNQRNAQRSTGPKSRAGKALVAQNARKHGLLVMAPVVPGLERVQDWHRHLQQTCESLAPVGHLEVILAERVALILWRLARAAHYEQHSIEARQEEIPEAIHEQNKLAKLYQGGSLMDSTWPEDIQGSAELAEETARIFAALPSLPDNAPVTASDAGHLISMLASALGLDDDLPIPEVPTGDPEEELFEWVQHTTWTGALLRNVLATYAIAADEEPDAVLARLSERTRVAAIAPKMAWERTQAQMARMQQKRLLPEALTLEKVSRYETHLERSLSRALHELERLQARREGKAVLPPIAMDVTGMEG